MIPRIVHQVWPTAELPSYASDTWRTLNPGWQWKLWTDDDLSQLVRDAYPELEELYHSYPRGVQRADLGRYMILAQHGGVYADVDSECLASLEPLASETRAVLCEEPVEQQYHGQRLGLERFYFNGIMASPAGHPFWPHLIETVRRSRYAKDDVIESTGPLVLSGAIASYADRHLLSLNSCHLFTPHTSLRRESTAAVHGPHSHLRLANHFWQGSWLLPVGQRKKRRVELFFKTHWRRAKYHLTRGPHLTHETALASIDRKLLQGAVTTGETISVLIPVRDAEPFLDRCLELLLSLDYPSHLLRIVFCEGDSTDGTVAKLQALKARHEGRFREIRLLSLPGGPQLERSRRWLPRMQRARRSHLARVRNHLLDKGLDAGDDWALWLDADVCDYAPSILNRLLAERRKVVTPDCRLTDDGPSYDLNAFLDPTEQLDQRYYKHVHRGLYMPPANHDRRRHLHTMRFLDRVPLSSVGGTMLLVDASVHRAGVRFPELPYENLLETEGFGRLCRNCGVTPIGLPNVWIKHASS